MKLNRNDGSCWGLDLRKCARRLIPASKTSPNISAGLRRWATKAPEAWLVPIKTLRTKKPTFGSEGKGRSHRITSLGIKTYGGLGSSPSDTKVMVDHSKVTRGLRRTSTPKVIKHQDETRRGTQGPSSGTGVRVKREYVRRLDLYTSHHVILPRNRL